MKVGYRPEIVQTPMMVKQSSWDSWWWDWMRSPVWMRWRWGEGALKNSRPEMEIDWLEYPNTNWARVANWQHWKKEVPKTWTHISKRKTEHEPPLLNVSRNRDQWWLISGGHVCKCMQTECVVGFYVFSQGCERQDRGCAFMFVCVRERESYVICILQRVTQWV